MSYKIYNCNHYSVYSKLSAYEKLNYSSGYNTVEVVKVKIEDGKERYFVADDGGLPIEPIY
ncbi:MAG: hypothetical protein ACRC8M_02560 [Cetobacterium sp.]|uniref:hypothetical protein n=1 Tax=Cetobacterium sp. TaxID=2071632 RepID=UPI003F2BD0BB